MKICSINLTKENQAKFIHPDNPENLGNFFINLMPITCCSENEYTITLMHYNQETDWFGKDLESIHTITRQEAREFISDSLSYIQVMEIPDDLRSEQIMDWFQDFYNLYMEEKGSQPSKNLSTHNHFLQEV